MLLYDITGLYKVKTVCYVKNTSAIFVILERLEVF